MKDELYVYWYKYKFLWRCEKGMWLHKIWQFDVLGNNIFTEPIFCACIDMNVLQLNSWASYKLSMAVWSCHPTQHFLLNETSFHYNSSYHQ